MPGCLPPSCRAADARSPDGAADQSGDHFRMSPAMASQPPLDPARSLAASSPKPVAMGSPTARRAQCCLLRPRGFRRAACRQRESHTFACESQAATGPVRAGDLEALLASCFPAKCDGRFLSVRPSNSRFNFCVIQLCAPHHIAHFNSATFGRDTGALHRSCWLCCCCYRRRDGGPADALAQP